MFYFQAGIKYYNVFIKHAYITEYSRIISTDRVK